MKFIFTYLILFIAFIIKNIQSQPYDMDHYVLGSPRKIDFQPFMGPLNSKFLKVQYYKDSVLLHCTNYQTFGTCFFTFSSGKYEMPWNFVSLFDMMADPLNPPPEMFEPKGDQGLDFVQQDGEFLYICYNNMTALGVISIKCQPFYYSLINNAVESVMDHINCVQTFMDFDPGAGAPIQPNFPDKRIPLVSQHITNPTLTGDIMHTNPKIISTTREHGLTVLFQVMDGTAGQAIKFQQLGIQVTTDGEYDSYSDTYMLCETASFDVDLAATQVFDPSLVGNNYLINLAKLKNNKHVVLYSTDTEVYIKLINADHSFEADKKQIQNLTKAEVLETKIREYNDGFILIVLNANKTEIIVISYDNNADELCRETIQYTHDGNVPENSVNIPIEVLVYKNTIIVNALTYKTNTAGAPGAQGIITSVLYQLELDTCSPYPSQPKISYQSNNLNEGQFANPASGVLALGGSLNFSKNDGYILAVFTSTRPDGYFVHEYHLEQIPKCVEFDIYNYQCSACLFGYTLNDQLTCDYFPEVEILRKDGEYVAFKRKIDRCVQYDKFQQTCLLCQQGLQPSPNLIRCDPIPEETEPSQDLMDESSLNTINYSIGKEDAINKMITQHADDITRSKINCPDGCNKCDADSQCIDCSDGQFFNLKDKKCQSCIKFGDKCVSICPKGFDQSGSECVGVANGFLDFVILGFAGMIAVIILPFSLFLCKAKKDLVKIQVDRKVMVGEENAKDHQAEQNQQQEQEQNLDHSLMNSKEQLEDKSIDQSNAHLNE